MSEKTTIVEAVAFSSGRGDGNQKSGLARAIEEAMAKTIAQAYEEGLTGDPVAIRERMQATRDRVKAEFNASKKESNPAG